MQAGGYSLGELASHIGAEVVGDPEARVTGLGVLASADVGELSFLASPAFRRFLPVTRASAVVLAPRDVAECNTNCIVTDDPRLGFTRLSRLFDDRPLEPPGCHPASRVDDSAEIAEDASIGPNAVIGPRARIASQARVGANCTVGADCEIGAGTFLMPNVVLYHRVRLGVHCIVHSGAVIGSDGFGFTPDAEGRLEPLAQIGGVRIGNHVSIGSSTTIDRGAIEDTVIEDGVKIDNQVQVGHNCVIGAHSLLCGCVGLAGSTRIGRHCVLAGMVGVGGNAGPVEITDGVVVSGMTHVSRSITEPGMYSGGLLYGESRQWKRNAVRFTELDSLAKRLARLEKKIGQ